MKKSFMTRVLAVGLSTAMAFSVPVVGNFTTAFADTAASSSAALAMSFTQKDAEVGTRMVFSLKGSQASKWKVVRAASSDKAVAAIAKTTSKKVAVEAQGAGAAKVSVRVRKTKDKREKVLKIRLNITAADSTITSVEQTEAKKLVATLSKPVESVAAADFAVTRNDEAKTVIPVTAATLDADKTHVTIETETDMMDGQVYTVTYTAATKDKTVSTAQFTAKTVEKAVLTDVKLTATNGFKATFSADASKDITKENFAVKSVDGKFTPTVKSVTFATDGLTADVVLNDQMVSGNAYNVTVGDVTKEMQVVFGEVAKAEIVTTTAEKDKETKIDFKLYDAAGVDVTSTIKVDDCVKLSGADGYIFENSKASDTTIIMDSVGSVANVTLTYNPMNGTGNTVQTTGTITCVAPAAVTSTKTIFTIQNGDKGTDGLPKFYLKSFKSNDKVYLDDYDNMMYFTALDENGKAISYDSYEISSSNNNRLLVSEDVVSGKYMSATITPVSEGDAQVIIKAKKDGSEVNTVPVTVHVRAARVPSSLKLSTTGFTISNTQKGSFVPTVYDQYGDVMKNVTVNLEVADSTSAGEVENYLKLLDVNNGTEINSVTSATPVVVSPAGITDVTTFTTAKIVATVQGQGTTKDLRVPVNVTVKVPDMNARDNYEVQLSNSKVDFASSMGHLKDLKVDVKMVHKKGNYFVNYVTDGAIDSITVRRGSVYYDKDLFKEGQTAVKTSKAIAVNPDKGVMFTLNLADEGAEVLNLTRNKDVLECISREAIYAETNDLNVTPGIAETGTYYISVKLNNGSVISTSLVVSNTIEMPSLTFDKTSTSATTLIDGFKDCVSSSVDLIQDDDASILGVMASYNNKLVTQVTTPVGSKAIMYALVHDRFEKEDYCYYVPVGKSILFN